MKRVTLIKDPNKGIGCTIKNAATHIFVHRILEDGPIAETGVLRPGEYFINVLVVFTSCLIVYHVMNTRINHIVNKY